MNRICVFCGSSFGADPLFRRAASELGLEIASRGIELVYGGGKVGLMGTIARAAVAAGGRVVGVIPESLRDKELAFEGCTELHIVGSMHERKAMMMELAEGFIAMPGGYGTFEELFEVLTWLQLGFHAKPAGLLNAVGYYNGLLAFLDHVAESSFILPEHRTMIPVSEDPSELIELLTGFEVPDVDKVRWIRGDED